VRCSARQEAFGTTHEHTSQKQCRAGAPIRASGPLALDRGRAETRESWCSMRPPVLVGRPSHRLTTSHARDIRAFDSSPRAARCQAVNASDSLLLFFAGLTAPSQVVREARQEFKGQRPLSSVLGARHRMLWPHKPVSLCWLLYSIRVS